jgi:methylenetetrahydrofolate reductase (NADPH)
MKYDTAPQPASSDGMMASNKLDSGAAHRTEPPPNPTSISETLRGYSIEINPNDANVVDLAMDRLDPSTEVFLTWIPGADPMDLIGPAKRLRRAGLVPVPHIGARHIQSADQLEQLAARLVSDAGVDRVLIIGGDRATPAGPYECSLAVMQTEIFQKSGIVRFAIAGFPEGNPCISEIAVNEALDSKVRFARSAGLKLSIITQFCFEAEPIIEWLRRIRGQGIDVPVRVGLAGPAGIITLARYAMRCGIGNSLRVLTEKPSFARLLVEKGPEPIIRTIASAAENASTRNMPLDIAGLHFFVFGGFNKTVDWIDAARGE